MANAIPSKKVRLNPKNYYLGAKGPQVTWLGERLRAHGFDMHYSAPGKPGKSGPGPVFYKADQLNVQQFQQAQGWTGSDADGFPGAETLKLLDEAVKPLKSGWRGTLHVVGDYVDAIDGGGTLRPAHNLKKGSTVSVEVRRGLPVKGTTTASEARRWFVQVGKKPHAFYYRLDTGKFSRAAGGSPAAAPAAKAPKVKDDPIAKLVAIAKSQVGYHEGRSKSSHGGYYWNNIQKYAQQVPGLGWNNGGPWCATFVSWCVMKAGLADYYPRTATVSVAMDWFKQKGEWSEYPAIGAQVIYGTTGSSHTGLVYDYDSTYIYTVEGNTNTNGSAEGDGVYAKKRVRRDSYVHGYGYPKIPGYKLKSADPNYKG